MRDNLYIDFETYSEAKLPKTGPWAYSKHPSTKVLMMWWAFNEGEPSLWAPHEGRKPPPWVKNLKSPFFKIHAQNDFFELCIMRNVLKWPIPGPEFWHDISAEASALALPRSLEKIGDALGLNGVDLKDPKGKKLIRWFCTPKVTKVTTDDLFSRLNGEIVVVERVLKARDPKDHPEEWGEFVNYGRQDTISARANMRNMRPLSDQEREVWELDRKINLRGVRFDVANVKNAIAIRDAEITNLLGDLAKLTNGALLNIASRDQFLSYIRRLGVKIPDAKKATLSGALNDEYLDPLARKIIGLRLSLTKTSLAKYDKLLEIVDPDTDRAHGLLRYHGASTGRWSGNLFQPQNLPRPSFNDTDACISLFKFKDPELLRMLYGDVLEALSSSLRGMIIASEGCRLVVSDFSQIESRVLAWLCRDQTKIDAYREGRDIYKVNASLAFRVPYSEVTKSQRTIGKVIELACGYQGGVGAFNQFARLYGLDLPDERVRELIEAWRSANKNVVSFWHNIQKGAINAVANTGREVRVGPVVFKVVGSGRGRWLYCRLPSSRLIAYHRPEIESGRFGGDKLVFYGVNSLTNQYTKLDTYGGKLVENITQAVARDIMADRMIAIEKAGYPIILSVHDEVITDTPIGHGSIKKFNKIMKTGPAWSKGLPIDADGYESRRYKK